MGNMLPEIPFVSGLIERIPSMDYEGQKLAEKLYQWVIVLFAAVGFLWGYICQQFIQTLYIFGAGIVLASLLVIPPWPIFRNHPLPWQKVQGQKVQGQKVQDQKAATSSGSGSGGKRKDKSKTS